MEQPRSSSNWLEEVLAEAALLALFLGAVAVLHLERVQSLSWFLIGLFR